MSTGRAAGVAAGWTGCFLIGSIVVGAFYDRAVVVLLLPGYFFLAGLDKLGLGFPGDSRGGAMAWDLAVTLVMVWGVLTICFYRLSGRKDRTMEDSKDNSS